MSLDIARGRADWLYYREHSRDPIAKQACAAIDHCWPVYAAVDHLLWYASEYPMTQAEVTARAAAALVPSIVLALSWSDG